MELIKVDAVFEAGVFKPAQPLSLASGQRVSLMVQVSNRDVDWPSDVAGVYQEIADEDRRLAESMIAGVKATWPVCEESP